MRVPADSQTNPRSQPQLLCWRDEVLAALDAVLEPWMSPQPLLRPIADVRRHRLVKKAERLFEHYDLNRSLNAETIAQELGVSRRTLFYAFRLWVGMGPFLFSCPIFGVGVS